MCLWKTGLYRYAARTRVMMAREAMMAAAMAFCVAARALNRMKARRPMLHRLRKVKR